MKYHLFFLACASCAYAMEPISPDSPYDRASLKVLTGTPPASPDDKPLPARPVTAQPPMERDSLPSTFPSVPSQRDLCLCLFCAPCLNVRDWVKERCNQSE